MSTSVPERTLIPETFDKIIRCIQTNCITTDRKAMCGDYVIEAGPENKRKFKLVTEQAITNRDREDIEFTSELIKPPGGIGSYPFYIRNWDYKEIPMEEDLFNSLFKEAYKLSNLHNLEERIYEFKSLISCDILNRLVSNLREPMKEKAEMFKNYFPEYLNQFLKKSSTSI